MKPKNILFHPLISRAILPSSGCLALSIGLLVPHRAAADPIFFGDDFGADTRASYTLAGTGNTGGVGYSATAGIGGGGGLLISDSGNPSISIIPGAVGANTPFTVGLGGANAVTMSMYLKRGGTARQGSFTFNGSSTLTWSAVPEPTSAMAGPLLGAGLLRRRRVRPDFRS